MVQKTPVIAICGPTASGKTALAVTVAEKIGAEIVSVDSGQIYRGLNIGTAKPTPAERNGIPFHLLDVADPSEMFSAARFRQLALAAIVEIQSRGRCVLMTVGTGLYLKSLEEGLFEGPGADPAVRAELEARIAEEGIEALEEELRRIDPEAAQTIKRNPQRLIRALEVHRLTGRPISTFWKEHAKGGGLRLAKYGLDVPKDESDRRIEVRVEDMIEQGLLAEVRGLLKAWGPAAPGLKLIGTKEIVAFLEGKTSLEGAIALVVKNTRQYAKRQRTWFKKDKDIQWFGDSDALIHLLTKQ